MAWGASRHSPPGQCLPGRDPRAQNQAFLACGFSLAPSARKMPWPSAKELLAACPAPPLLGGWSACPGRQAPRGGISCLQPGCNNKTCSGWTCGQDTNTSQEWPVGATTRKIQTPLPNLSCQIKYFGESGNTWLWNPYNAIRM